jgi:hypothetical protein
LTPVLTLYLWEISIYGNSLKKEYFDDLSLMAEQIETIVKVEYNVEKYFVTGVKKFYSLGKLHDC